MEEWRKYEKTACSLGDSTLHGCLICYSKKRLCNELEKALSQRSVSSAEVIVQGSYDQYGFNQYDLVGGLWVPFKFRVERYYKGTGTTIIDAAIPHLDIGWVKEFQENNGSFILFLKRDSQNAELLIPVSALTEWFNS
jgi:hypothetical protein